MRVSGWRGRNRGLRPYPGNSHGFTGLMARWKPSSKSPPSVREIRAGPMGPLKSFPFAYAWPRKRVADTCQRKWRHGSGHMRHCRRNFGLTSTDKETLGGMMIHWTLVTGAKPPRPFGNGIRSAPVWAAGARSSDLLEALALREQKRGGLGLPFPCATLRFPCCQLGGRPQRRGRLRGNPRGHWGIIPNAVRSGRRARAN